VILIVARASLTLLSHLAGNRAVQSVLLRCRKRDQVRGIQSSVPRSSHTHYHACNNYRSQTCHRVCGTVGFEDRPVLDANEACQCSSRQSCGSHRCALTRNPSRYFKIKYTHLSYLDVDFWAQKRVTKRIGEPGSS
jgi:hypothetical protein